MPKKSFVFDLGGLQKRLSNVEGRFQEGGDSYANYDRFIPESGINKIRLIPMFDNLYPFMPVSWHYDFMNQNLLCRKYTSYEKEVNCPVCNLVSDLLKSGEEGNIKIARKIKAVANSAWVVIDRLDKDVVDGLPKLKVWFASKRISNQLMGYLKEPKTWGNFLSVYEGHDMELKKSEVRTKGRGGYTSYTLSIYPQATPIIEEEKRIDELLEKIPEVVFRPRSEEDLKELVKSFYDTGLKQAKETESEQEEEEEDYTESPLPFKGGEKEKSERSKKDLEEEKELVPPPTPVSEKVVEEESTGDDVDDEIKKIMGV